IDAVNGCDLADLDAGDIRGIDHGDVHRDDTDDGRELSADQYAAAVAQRAVDAVAVTCGEYSDHRRALSHELRAISDARACRNAPQADDARPQAHHWFQRQLFLGFLALLRWVVAWVISIQNHAGANHVGPCLGAG